MTTKKVLLFSFFLFFLFLLFSQKEKKEKKSVLTERPAKHHVDAAAAGPRRSLGRQPRCPMSPPRRE
jgi:hypothetical protein